MTNTTDLLNTFSMALEALIQYLQFSGTCSDKRDCISCKPDEVFQIYRILGYA